MADSTILPAPRAALVARDGTTSPEFYRFFRGLSVTAGLPARVDDLTVRVDALEEGGGSTGNVVGKQSIVSAGVLSGGLVTLRLDGDQDAAPALSFYGALAAGSKGWQVFSSSFAALDNGDGTSSLDLADIPNTGTGVLLATTFDAKGRKTGSRAATITGTVGRIAVAHGDASDGLPTIDLATVADAGGGALLRFVRDAWGRLSGTSAATTSDLAEGTNLYFTAARVLATILTGLSTATNAAITAADTVLSALGKLQAQITDNLLPQGCIDGLKMVWVSGTALTVTSGAAYIPSLGKVLRATADIAKTGLSLAASTWYHVYLYSNAGTPDIELSTTAPAPPYSGTARTKTGDASKRYVGSVLTDAGAGIKNFYHHQRLNYIQYLTDVIPQMILNGGTATVSTSVNASAYVPVTARIAKLLGYNNSTTSFMFISNSDGPAVPSGYLAACAPQAYLAFDCLLDSSQTLVYAFNSTPSAGCFLRVMGYQYER